MPYEIVAMAPYLIAALAIGFLIWSRVRTPPKPRDLQDISGCLRRYRRASRKPIWQKTQSYITFHEGELPSGIAANIKSLEEAQIFHALSELNFELLKRYCEYPEHIKASVYNGTWGKSSRAADKPCLLVFEFILNGRKYELQRFMGDRQKGGPGMMPAGAPTFAGSEEPTYGFEQIEVRIDAMPMLVARRYSYRAGPYSDSVAILESQYDDVVIRDLLSLYMFAKHSRAVSTAKSSRNRRRHERARKAAEGFALAVASSLPVSKE